MIRVSALVLAILALVAVPAAFGTTTNPPPAPPSGDITVNPTPDAGDPPLYDDTGSDTVSMVDPASGTVGTVIDGVPAASVSIDCLVTHSLTSNLSRVVAGYIKVTGCWNEQTGVPVPYTAKSTFTLQEYAKGDGSWVTIKSVSGTTSAQTSANCAAYTSWRAKASITVTTAFGSLTDPWNSQTVTCKF